MNNVITAFFAPGVFRIQTEPRYQYNYGQVLAFSGITLPDAYEVHFSNVLLGDSFTQIGDADGVAIPDQLFQTGASIYAWIFLHAADSDGETVYMVTIPVVRRAKPSDLEPTPVEESAITEAIAALQTAVGKTTEQSTAAAASAAEAATSATESAGSSLDAEAWAVGQRDGVDVPDTDPTYQNNAKYYADEAGQYIGGLNLENGTGEYSLVQKTGNEWANTASGKYAVAFGMRNTASMTQAFAHGWNNTASGFRSHAEGEQTTASGRNSHTEGSQTVASGDGSHAEGVMNTTSGAISHAEGQLNTASGGVSHAEGDGTIANHRDQHSSGAYNIPDPSTAGANERGTYIEIVGNGTADDARSNARTLDWDGNETLAGKLTLGAAPTGNFDAATKLYVDGIRVRNIWDVNSYIAAETENVYWDSAQKVYSVIDGANVYWNRAGLLNRMERLTRYDETYQTYLPAVIANTTFGGTTQEPVYFSGTDTAGTLKLSCQSALIGNIYEFTFGAADQEYVYISANGGLDGSGALTYSILEPSSDGALHALAGNSLLNAATGTNSVALGSFTLASGDSAMALGNGAVASGAHSFAAGLSAFATGESSASLGRANGSSGAYSVTIGYNNRANGTAAAAVGQSNTSTGNQSVAIGDQNTASSTRAIAIGYKNTASAQGGIAIGNSNKATGGNALAMGYTTTASGTNASTNGEQTIATHRNQHVFGAFNAEDPSSTAATAKGTYIEIVGNGTSNSARNNARTLDWDGNETLAGKLTMGAAPTGNFDAATKLYVDDKATELRGEIPTKTSDLTNDAGYIAGLTILSYGRSTWNDFLDAYTAQKVVYCRASSNADPSSGAQTRLAFMAYVNQESLSNLSEVEFQYYRSVSTHTQTQQGDQVVVYKLHKTNGWSVTTRETASKIAVGAGLSMAYSGNTITISPGSTLATTQYADGKASDAQTAAEAYTDTALAAIPAIPKADNLADGAYILQATVTSGTPAYSWVAVTTWEGGSY